MPQSIHEGSWLHQVPRHRIQFQAMLQFQTLALQLDEMRLRESRQKSRGGQFVLQLRVCCVEFGLNHSVPISLTLVQDGGEHQHLRALIQARLRVQNSTQSPPRNPEDFLLSFELCVPQG